MRYWLMKSEPDVYSIDDLKRDSTTEWEGVRNYQARNFMMKDMQVGDLAIFYHSNAEPPGAAGTMRVSRTAKPDSTAQKKTSEYFDAKATKDNPIWFCVEVAFEKKFANLVTLEAIRQDPKLKELLILRKGNRLSITPMTESEFHRIVQLGQNKPDKSR